MNSVIFKDNYSNVYTFYAYPFDVELNESAAIYIVTHAYNNVQGGISHQVIYVGETNNLKQRFSNHHKADCFVANEATHLCLFFTMNGEYRLDVESKLIEHHTPPCND